MSVDTVVSLQTRLDRVRANLATARAQSAALGSHVEGVTRLVDDAAARHEAWDARLAHMLESDTRRSAEVARRQEALAVALGIGPRGAANPLWRGLQHIALFVGVVLSFIFISPFEALWQWGVRNRRNQTVRSAPVERQGGRNSLGLPRRGTTSQEMRPLTSSAAASTSLAADGGASNVPVSSVNSQLTGGFVEDSRRIAPVPEDREADARGVLGEVLHTIPGTSFNRSGEAPPGSEIAQSFSSAPDGPEQNATGSQTNNPTNRRRRRSRSTWRELRNPMPPVADWTGQDGATEPVAEDVAILQGDDDELSNATRRPSWAAGEPALGEDSSFSHENAKDFWETFD